MAQTKQTAIQTTVSHLHESEARWFAVYTRSKSEKVVQRLLTNKEIESYLPLQKVTRRYTRKIKHYEVPLITCYIFVKITKKEYVPVLETENVAKFIRFARNLYSIPEEEINLLRRVVGEGEDVVAEPGNFKEGDEVEVIGGKLTGLKGRMVERQGKKHLVVELESIGYTLRMTVDIALLRKI
ncbi:MAG: UpxY family transcription antiterminator [Bacteroidales bacterium]|nr:UpxY family transcription antiterminator [Bacteroidales bacterium]MCF8314279.1 UpxY family transcription antiterminator [Saprospiraceae bacterium]MCF8443102.1 UpxY family transcription antiterminator [Saprospiraceae bacterium]